MEVKVLDELAEIKNMLVMLQKSVDELKTQANTGNRSSDTDKQIIEYVEAMKKL